MTNIVEKPWGREIILTPEGLSYTAKILEIKAGKKLSLQYHDQKVETLTIVSGQANIVWGNSTDSLKTEPMLPNQGYHIPVNTIHRFVAITDCILFEASTPETGTTYRIQDDSNRSDETETVRNSPNRGWSQK